MRPIEEMNPRDVAVLASLDNVRRIVKEKSYLTFIWPNEEEVVKNTTYKITFNDGEDLLVEPLLIDLTTAGMLCVVYDALNESNQIKFEEWIAKSRATCVRMIEIGWNSVQPKN